MLHIIFSPRAAVENVNEVYKVEEEQTPELGREEEEAERPLGRRIFSTCDLHYTILV